MKILPRIFYKRPTEEVAQKLLGRFLVRRIGHSTISGMITEVEAYIGTEDRASHASRLWRGSLRAARGKTPRTEVMFGEAGNWYVYLIYGMYYCLNIVTGKEGYPAAVLIRSVDHTTGPGRLCKKFRIDRDLNKKPATRKSGLWIEDRGVRIPAKNVKRTKRIGVEYAGVWKNRLWRFVLSD